MPKHILVIQDISCIGRCSLLAALPVFNAVGIRVTPLPTALLSSHTGFPDPYRRDLTEDMSFSLDQWSSLDLNFDAIHIGYLAGAHQLEVLNKAIQSYKAQNCLLFVDPVMGDWGKPYSYCDDVLLQGMRQLCQKADVILPNRTEAAMLLNELYHKGADSPKNLLDQLTSLQNLGSPGVVITGISGQPGYIGAACLAPGMQTPKASFSAQVKGSWPGTGDLFSAALEAAMLFGHSLESACDIAVRFIAQCLKHADPEPKAARFGAPFEEALPWLADKLIGK